MRQSVLGMGVLVLGVLVGCSDSAAHHGGTVDEEGGNGPTQTPDQGDGIAGDAGTGQTEPGGGSAGEGGVGGDGSVDLPDLGQLSALMRRATSCEDLGLRARAVLRGQLERDIELSLGVGNEGGSGNQGGSDSQGNGGTFAMGGGFPGGGTSNVAGSWSSGGASGGMASGGAAGSNAAGGSGTGQPEDPSFTGTNTQIPNIDEPDFVKTDGKNLYIVQRGRLRIAAAYPAATMAELASAPIEGTGLEMFLAAGVSASETRLVVYSAVDSSTLNGLGAEVHDWSSWLKVTIFTLEGGSLSTSKEYYFEGNYLSARRTGERVRQVLSLYQSYPEGLRTYATEADKRKAEILVLEKLAQDGKSAADLSSAEIDRLFRETLVEVLLAEDDDILADIKGEDLVPRAFVVKDGQLVAANMACDRVFIPAAGTLDSNITYIPELDLSALDDLPTGSALLGGSQNLYQNGARLVLASPPSWGSQDAQTYLHMFDLNDDEPLSYHGSGSVEGSVSGSFALDEQNGDLHVVSSLWQDGTSLSKLFTLQSSDTALEVVGESEDIAPGELLQSVRFVGATAYVVTFRNVDPLFVFDVSVAEEPTQLAELEIPGFSQYMHPIGDDQLLTIGPAGAGWNANVVLRLFDVSDKAHPELSFSHEFAGFGSSEAQIDHRAFTYFADRGLLAIPFSGYSWDYQSYEYSFINQLALVKVDEQSGFEELGAIDASSLPGELQAAGGCYWNMEGDGRIERGTFIEDTLYAIASHGVVAAKIADPAETIATLPLTEQCEVGGSGGTGGTGNGFGGSSGSDFGGNSVGGEGPDLPSGGSGPSGGFASGGTGTGGTG